jgi:hypothetical protein
MLGEGNNAVQLGIKESPSGRSRKWAVDKLSFDDRNGSTRKYVDPRAVNMAECSGCGRKIAAANGF